MSFPVKYFTCPIHLIFIQSPPIIFSEEATQYAVLFSFPKFPLSPRYPPHHPILKRPQAMFFPKYDQLCFPPIYNRHSIFRNDITPNITYISFLLAARFGCCEKQIIPLQRCIENIIMYFLVPLQLFSTKAKTCSMQKTDINVLVVDSVYVPLLLSQGQ